MLRHKATCLNLPSEFTIARNPEFIYELKLPHASNCTHGITIDVTSIFYYLNMCHYVKTKPKMQH